MKHTEALKTSLELLAVGQPQQEPESECNPQDLCAGCRCKYAALAAPVQEPIGYFTVNDYDKWEQIDGTSGKPFYEHPAAQRTWVGLTNEQFLEAARLAEAGNYLVAFQRIQQWLKEGNT